MTRIYSPTGEFVPVTVLQSSSCPIIQVKKKETDGYDAIQVAAEPCKEKNVTKPLLGHFAKAQVVPHSVLREFRVGKTDDLQPGQELKVTNFTPGDLVDVTGYTRGKGFAGVVKRHRFRGGPRTHGQSDRARAPGSSGGQRPQRVLKGVRGPGHLGHAWTTTQRLKVVQVDAENNLLMIHGAVPGPNGGVVSVQTTTRPKRVPKIMPKASAKADKAKAGKDAAKAPAKAAPKK